MIRRAVLVLVAVALCVAACSPGSGETTPTGSFSTASVGSSFVSALARGNFAAAEGMEDAQMSAAAPAAHLSSIWQGFVGQYGAFESVGAVSTASDPPYTIAIVSTQFANYLVGLRVTVDSSGEVAGLFVGSAVAGSPSASVAPASYVRPGSFTEIDVTVGAAPWALPGTLTMPTGPGPFPAVVLVAGSGPEDRDETFGPNKPFEDLAWGLASAGIAVLRYDKRTLVYAKQMAADESGLTVRQETTDDAVAAIGLLRGTAKVDPGRVFLVGHSLGAYLAPRIAAQVPGQLHGLVLLEAPSTSLPALLLIQEQYLASLGGSPSPQVEQQLATLKAQVALAESASLSPSTPASELPLNTPASYWLDLRTYDPLATAAGLGLPMFFSQGGRDYQVPPSELQAWETALVGRTNVTFKTYPPMDHLLLDGSGPITPAEYSVPGHVDPQLVADVAAWILRQ
jgi:dienelactone hydrolase